MHLRSLLSSVNGTSEPCSYAGLLLLPQHLSLQLLGSGRFSRWQLESAEDSSMQGLWSQDAQEICLSSSVGQQKRC